MNKNQLYTAESYLYAIDWADVKTAVSEAHKLMTMINSLSSDVEAGIKALQKEKAVYDKAIDRIKTFVKIQVDKNGGEKIQLPSVTYYITKRDSMSYDHLSPEEFYWELPTLVTFDKFKQEKIIASIDQVTKTDLSKRKPIDPAKGIPVVKEFLASRKKKVE